MTHTHRNIANRFIRYWNASSYVALIFALLLIPAISGQSVPSPTITEYNGIKVQDAITKVKSGDFHSVHIEVIAQARAVEAIPVLEEAFARKAASSPNIATPEDMDEAKIAEVLVKLGVKDDTYWNYLVQLATPAIDSDAPDLSSYDVQRTRLQEPSPEFISWAKVHNLSLEDAALNSVYLDPGRVMLLGGAGDRRAIPLLRRGLLSKNYFIENAAAMGLAEIKDEPSVPFIVEACRKAPPEMATTIAENLVYFDDPQAQSAVDQYIPADKARLYREKRARGQGPLH